MTEGTICHWTRNLFLVQVIRIWGQWAMCAWREAGVPVRDWIPLDELIPSRKVC